MSAAEKKSDGIGSMIKLGLVLAAYAVAACTVLAIVNNITSPVITANNIRKANEAMKAVFPSADGFESVEGFVWSSGSGTTKIDSISLAKKDGNVLGAVTQVSGPTYDHSTIMVGMDADGIVTGMRYLENTDTPSFGMNGSSETYTVGNGKTFYGQFAGMDSSKGFRAGETFDAISGATITSNGIAVMMEDACSAMKDCLSQSRSGK
ncbi:MAG: FMN-binding protein [Treponema sp.]|nr:FMN-binding protein [Treponema sp.]